MDFYAEQIMEHYRDPRNAGKIAKPTAKVFMNNSLCGDKIEVTVLIKNSVLKDFKFMSDGCAISVASASMLSEAIIGKKVQEILKMTIDDVYKVLGIKLGFNRVKCMMLPLDAVKRAIQKTN